jgi:hypothetical protein
MSELPVSAQKFAEDDIWNESKQENRWLQSLFIAAGSTAGTSASGAGGAS